MHFVYPNVLWALSILALPIIIHFFNIRRYKKIYFSDVQRIKQIAQQTQVRNKLKERLILIARILSLLFLIMAFAQPVIKKNNSSISHHTTNNEVVIYIDNSFSMENLSEDGKLLDIAIKKAKEIIQMFSKSTKFILLTNQTEFHQNKTLNQDEALEYLSKISVQSGSIPLSILLNRIHTLHLKNPLVFVISDAQKKFTDVSHLQKNKTHVFYFLITPQQKNNLSIDSVWLDNPVILPNTLQKLYIKISNHSSENAQDLPVKLVLNDSQVALLNVSIPANESTETFVSFIPQNQTIQFGKVFINDFPISFDDALFFAINTHIRLKVMLINGSKNPVSSKYFQSFFQNDSIFQYTELSESQINFSELAQQDVIVLNEITEFSTGLEEQLKTLSQNGKCIIVIPFLEKDLYALPSEFQKINWKIDTSSQQIHSDILKHPLFASAFEKTDHAFKMPAVKEHLFADNLTIEPIIELNNTHPFLFNYQNNNRKYFLFTSSFNPEKNQLTLHALFVPILYQLAFTAIPKAPVYYYSSENNLIKIPNLSIASDNSPKIIAANTKDNTFQIIPGFKTDNQIAYVQLYAYYNILPGHYYLQVNNKNILGLSFNFNRAESDMQFYTEKELKSIIEQYQLNTIQVNDVSNRPIQKIIQSEIKGTTYWKLCLILALLFFLIESFLSMNFLSKPLKDKFFS